jgi:hypothetical protein
MILTKKTRATWGRQFCLLPALSRHMNRDAG